MAEFWFKKRDIPEEASLTKYQVRIYMDNHMAWTLTILFSRASENRETKIIKTKYAMGMVIERKR